MLKMFVDMVCARRDRWWVLFALVLWCVSAACVLRGFGKLYFGHPFSDFHSCFYPWRVFMCRWSERGVLPWWDPHVFGGTPVLEMQQRGVWYPVSMLCIAALPTAWSLLVEMVAHVGVGLAASWFGLRRGFGVSGGAALVGASCFMFGGTMAGRVAGAHFTVVAASGLMVLALGGLYRAFATRDAAVRRRWLAGTGGVCALMVFAGAQQYVVFTGCAQLAMVAAVFGFWGKVKFRRLASLFAGVWVVAAMLSAPQWLPTLAYLPFSARGAAASSANASGMFSTMPGPLELATVALEFFTPMPLGDEVRTAHLPMKSLWETGSYPGIIGLLLGFGALLVARRRGMGNLGRVALAGTAVAAFGLYLCAGGYFPGMGSFREPMKARTVVVLGLAVLSAVGFDLLRLQKRRRVGEYFVATLTCALALSAGYVALLVVLRSGAGAGLADWLLGTQAPFDPYSAPAWYSAKANPETILPAITTSTLRALGFAAVALGAVVLIWRVQSPKRARTLICLVAVVAAVEPLLVHYPLFVSRNEFAKADIPAQVREYYEPLIRKTAEDSQPPWRVSVHHLLSNMTHHVDGLYELAGYDPIMPHNANNRQLLIGSDAMMRHGGGGREELLPFITDALGVRYESYKWNPFEGKPLRDNVRTVNTDASLFALTRNVVAGRVSKHYFGPSIDGQSFVVPMNMARAKEGDTVPDEVAQIVQNIAQNIGTSNVRNVDDNAPAVEKVTSDSIRMLNPMTAPHRYELQVQAAQPALLLMRQTALPGWRVRVNNGGEIVPWIANNWMVAVPVPQGTNTVTFLYRPARLAISWMIFALGIVLALALADGALRNPLRRRKSDEVPSIPKA